MRRTTMANTPTLVSVWTVKNAGELVYSGPDFSEALVARREYGGEIVRMDSNVSPG